MHTSQLYSDMVYGVNTTREIVDIRKKFIVIKRKLGVHVATGAVAVGGLYFWYGFYKKRKTVQSLLRKEEFTFNNPVEYRSAMSLMDEFNRLLTPLERKFDKSPKVNFWLYKKGFLECKRTIDVLGQYRNTLKESLDTFNNLSQNEKHYNGFEFISGDKLWSKRVKSYEYIV